MMTPGGDSSKQSEFSGGNLSRSFLLVLGIVLAAGIAVNLFALRQRRAAEMALQTEVALAQADADRVRAQIVVPTTERLPRGQNFAGVLQHFGLTAEEAAGAVAAAQQAFNLRQLRAGNTIVVGGSVVGELGEITYKIEAGRMLHIVPTAPGFSA